MSSAQYEPDSGSVNAPDMSEPHPLRLNTEPDADEPAIGDEERYEHDDSEGEVEESLLSHQRQEEHHDDGRIGATTRARSSSAPQSYSQYSSPYSSMAYDDRACCGRLPVALYNVCILSLSFMLLFSAFNTCQSYLTSLLPAGLGNVSLTVCYLTVCSVIIFAPAVVHLLGEPRSMMIGASCYCLYMCSLIDLHPQLLMICSVIVGFGGSILWVASGSFLTRCSDENNRARNTAIFWSTFQSSAVIGNGSAFLIFKHVTPTQLFVCFCLVGCMGAITLTFIKPMRPKEEQQQQHQHHHVRDTNADTTATSKDDLDSIKSEQVNGADEANDDSEKRDCEDDGDNTELTVDDDESDVDSVVSIAKVRKTVVLPLPTAVHAPVVPLIEINPPPSKSQMRQVLSLFTTLPIICLCPLFFFIGASYSFWNGELPRMVPKDSIGLVLCMAGMMEVMGGTLFAWISMKQGRIVTLCLGASVFASGMYIATTKLMFDADGIKPAWDDVGQYAYMASACFGFADSCFNTQVYSLLGERYPSRGSIAFTAFNLVNNVGMGIGFWYQLLLPMHGSRGTQAQAFVQIILLACATLGFISANKYWARKSAVSRPTSKPATRRSSCTTVVFETPNEERSVQ